MTTPSHTAASSTPVSHAALGQLTAQYFTTGDVGPLARACSTGIVTPDIAWELMGYEIHDVNVAMLTSPRLLTSVEGRRVGAQLVLAVNEKLPDLENAVTDMEREPISGSRGHAEWVRKRLALLTRLQAAKTAVAHAEATITAAQAHDVKLTPQPKAPRGTVPSPRW